MQQQPEGRERCWPVLQGGFTNCGERGCCILGFKLGSLRQDSNHGKDGVPIGEELSGEQDLQKANAGVRKREEEQRKAEHSKAKIQENYTVIEEQ